VSIEGGQVRAVQIIGRAEPIACRQVISTIALPLLARVCPGLDENARHRLGAIDYLAVLCGLLKLKRPVTSSFWVNVNDPRTPYNGIIEYSNLNRHLELGGRSIVYVPLYLEASHPRYGYDEETLLEEFVELLRCINPDFERSWIEEHHISRATHAQAVCTVGFAASVPAHRAEARGLYLTDSAQFYPEDRTISAAIRLGRRVAAMVLEDAARGLASPGAARGTGG
jgi:protoporphyrinogen oxidase